MTDIARRVWKCIEVDRHFADMGNVVWIDLSDSDVGSGIAELCGRLDEAILDDIEAVEHRAHGMARGVAACRDGAAVVINDVLAGDGECAALSLHKG